MAPGVRKSRDRATEELKARLISRTRRLLDEARSAFDEAMERELPPGGNCETERRRRDFLLHQKAGEIRMAEAILAILKEI